MRTRLNGRQISDKSIVAQHINVDRVVINTNNGVLTLVNSTTFFNVSGKEDLTLINGLSNGRITIEWLDDRKLIFSENLEISGSIDRNVKKGDISEFLIIDSKAKEIDYVSPEIEDYGGLN